MTADPRYTLRTQWPDVKVYVRHLPDLYGQTTWTDQGAVIEIALDLGHAQQTMTLAHELGHLVAGTPCRSFCSRNERQVIEWTARYLIPDAADLAERLKSSDVAAVADELGLPPEAVYHRLAYMTPAEVDEAADRLGGAGRSPEAMAARRRPAKEER